MLFLLACTADTPTPGEGESPDAAAFTLDELSDRGLTTATSDALALMPRWLQGDVRLALVQLGSDDQDRIAEVVLGVDDPMLLDEVGFSLAHLSKQVLKSRNFHPELLVENAALVYEADALLPYVELVETGDDTDWSTTARYRVLTDGQEATLEIDRETYYWYVVHPRIEDEHPWYVEPWAECDSGSLECASEPGVGQFWRSFLWAEAAADCPSSLGCPVVSDYLAEAQYLYGEPSGNDAVHAVAGMMLDSPQGSRWLSFGAYDERSIQPTRIYGLGRGNCGEWADMTTALSRTALIPNVNVTPSSWDHTWNAFWLDRWVAWEPVNWAFDYAYGSGYVTYGTRGDTLIEYATEQYTSTVASLDVTVLDQGGTPVDGATAAIYSPYEDSWWYAGELVSGLDGLARFPVGAEKSFALVVFSDALGDSEGVVATEGILAGESAAVEVRLPGAMAPEEAVAEEAEDGEPDAEISLSLEVEGRLVGESYRFGGDLNTQVAPAPPLSQWVLSEEAYEDFLDGESFTTLEGNRFDASVPRVVVIANNTALATAAVGTLSLGVQPDGGDPLTEQFPVVLLPGEHLAVRVATAGE